MNVDQRSMHITLETSLLFYITLQELWLKATFSWESRKQNMIFKLLAACSMAVVISSMHESMQYIGSLFIMLWATTQTNYLDLWEIKWISFKVQHISTYQHINISTSYKSTNLHINSTYHISTLILN